MQVTPSVANFVLIHFPDIDGKRATDADDFLTSRGYILRAVSPGKFHHPAASVEDMYRPDFTAHTDAGTVTITE